MLVSFEPLHFVIALSPLSILLPLAWRRTHSVWYAACLAAFWVYLILLAQAVIFPFVVSLNSAGPFSLPINLVPFYFGRCEPLSLCVQGILENILLTAPFGFGINFLWKVTLRRVAWLGLGLGVLCELAQLALDLGMHSGFRSVDINDALLNGFGVCLGWLVYHLCLAAWNAFKIRNML